MQPEIEALPEVQEALELLAPWLRRLVPRSFDDIRKLPWYDAVQSIRGSAAWQASSPDFPATPQASQPLFNPMGFARLQWLLEAAEANTFGTEAFMWMDGECVVCARGPRVGYVCTLILS